MTGRPGTTVGPRLRRARRAPSRGDEATPPTRRHVARDGYPLLEVANVEVRFGGTTALVDVDIHAQQSAVTAVVGPNGAGKTTLFNVVSGTIAPLSGQVRVDGDDITTRSPRARAIAGLARTFQNSALFETLTVTENVLAGVCRFARSGLLRSILRTPRSMSDDRFAHWVARQSLQLLGLDEVAHERCSDLSYGERRRTEIARALAAGPRLLLLDEPSAGMDPVETRELADLVNLIVDVLGIGVLLVEHDMAMVDRCVDAMFVLEAGRVIASGPPGRVLRDDAVRAAYFGPGADHA